MFMEEIAVGDTREATTMSHQAQNEPAVAATPDEAGLDAASASKPAASTTGGPNMYGFLHAYRSLNENLEYAVTK